MGPRVTSSTATVRPPRITNPHWGGEGEDAAGHGDEVQLCADARGLDGRPVRFYVQFMDQGQWKPFRELDGTIKNGLASAWLVLQHPDAGEDAEEVDRSLFRFRAALI